jgi:uncharacterized membrane protein YcgQ (UPF0703/DUF1980 family)
MMKKKVFTLIAGLILLSGMISPEPDMWAMFSKTKFVEKLNKEWGMNFLYPKFPEELKAFDGKKVTVSGFYIPLDMNNSNIAVLSKFPMAECFFCGGSGPESVVVGYLKNAPKRKIKTDEIIKVRGILKLNEDDIEELNFILLEAEIILD